MKLQIFIFLALPALLAAPALEAITPAMADLVIEKTTQTSPAFWSVRVKNVGNGDAAATTLKMMATPGGSYSCPVAAIKAGGVADVPCKMPFKGKTGMSCEFILNPDKKLRESNFANNRKVSSTNPKFN